MACCGRPDPRNKKSSEQLYYERYGYLSRAQKNRHAEIAGSKCTHCDALTISDVENKCTVCNNPKPVEGA